jgi:iron(III) transport system permease protein
MFLSPRELSTLYNSLTISLATAVLTTLIAIPLTFLWHDKSFSRVRFFRYAILFPLFIPPFIHALTLDNLLILGTQLGILEFDPHVAAFRTVSGVTLILTVAYFPLSLLILVNSIRSIPRSLVDASRMIVSPATTLRRVILPLLLPGLTTGFLLSFIFAFTTYDVPEYFNVPSFGTEIFASFSAYFNTQRALLLSTIPAIITALLVTIMLRLLVKSRAFFTPSASSSYSIHIRNRWVLGSLWSFYAMMFFVSVIVPAMSLLINGNIFSPIVRHAMYSSRGIVWDTFWIAFFGGIATVLVALPVYWYIYRTQMGRIILLSLYSVPAITYAIVSILVFNQPFLASVYASTTMLIVVYVLRFIPIVCEVLYMHYSSINPSLLQAAHITSPVNVAMIKKIVWPIFRPALFLGWAVGFWLIAGELPITLLIQPPGFQTVANRIFIFIHYGSQDFTNTLTFILALLCLIPISIGALIMHYGTTQKT